MAASPSVASPPAALSPATAKVAWQPHQAAWDPNDEDVYQQYEKELLLGGKTALSQQLSERREAVQHAEW